LLVACHLHLHDQSPEITVEYLEESLPCLVVELE